MEVPEANSTQHSGQGPQWRPLSARQRRVVGVLIEKAKTTPDVYPLTLNALVAGCNQKSNRSPVVNYTVSDVEDTLEELKQMGAVVEVISESGRVPRYKHRMYEWLEVNKEELAVIAELLLRGEQTLGELRSHVSRMEPIADLAMLKTIIDRLVEKQLVTPLTPPGRGQVFCHLLYKERELEELRQRYQRGGALASDERRTQELAGESAGRVASGVTVDMFAELQVEVAQLQAEVAQLRQRVAALEREVLPAAEHREVSSMEP